MRVVFKKWLKKNKAYVAIWLIMGLVTLGLVIRELGVYTLVTILPFFPLFVVVLIRMAQELRK
jgi:hypothetical protein